MDNHQLLCLLLLPSRTSPLLTTYLSFLLKPACMLSSHSLLPLTFFYSSLYPIFPISYLFIFFCRSRLSLLKSKMRRSESSGGARGNLGSSFFHFPSMDHLISHTKLWNLLLSLKSYRSSMINSIISFDFSSLSYSLPYFVVFNNCQCVLTSLSYFSSQIL